MHTVIIAEKPSVGRDIARVLNCKGKGDGYLYGEGYVISWAIGHLATLCEPEDYNPALKKWRMADLPIIPQEMALKPIAKTEKQLQLLARLLNDDKAEKIICATDSGREGELIFRYIYQWAKCTKPVQRLWISSLTDTAIRKGLDTMKTGTEYDNLFASARCRAEADWLVGMNATRAFTLRRNELLPMGRVQTPTLAILVQRQKEIEAFDAKEYFEVEAQFTKGDASYTGMWFNPKAEENKSRLYEKDAAEALAAAVKGQAGIIESIETAEKRVPAPQLFDLTELQRECNRKLNLSAQKTLSIAQSLYEKHKMITYPRTDSRYLSNDMVPKLKTVLENQVHAPYTDFAAPLLTPDKLPVTGRMVNDAKVIDHHAIIPTGSKKPLSALSTEERAVYDRILRNFIAAFYPAHVYDVTTVVTQVQQSGFEKPDFAENGIFFESKGRMDKELGWTALYSHEKTGEKEKDAEPALPVMTKGDAFSVTEATALKKKTTPPKPYTEATLLSAMENAGRFVEDEALKEALKASGLGTPATRAAMIEKLISSKYIERKKKNLVPTEKGMKLIAIVPPELRSPETTGKWERGLTRIANGELDAGKFMESIKRYIHYLVKGAR
ncbi:MAG: DNA topoisomerase 3 [Defluviitaleaceae bacterium]|nr:DNA topoisomerase 3 [Defluviitaleaceae bacterium]MCL2275554.1 DNA topoisomerase 3 [Defluviitaleaceae bacterium]